MFLCKKRSLENIPNKFETSPYLMNVFSEERTDKGEQKGLLIRAPMVKYQILQLFMKRNIVLLSPLLLLFTTIAALAQQEIHPEKWTAKQASNWFTRGKWHQKIKLRPDPSINAKEFAVRYFKNKNLWDMAFAFLRDSDLKKLTLGVHELKGKDLFVKVTNYKTREPGYADFETHTKYTDLHTVVSGVEYIQVSARASSTIKTPYNDERDIEFYTVTNSRNLLSKPGKFFLIFPDDLHKQGVKVDTGLTVRKIVIKVKN